VTDPARSIRITCGECAGAGEVAEADCPACEGTGSLTVMVPPPATVTVSIEVDASGTLSIYTRELEGAMATVLEIANVLGAAFGVYPRTEPAR
jgi:DnaJ-class molecular chaperone